MFRDTVTLFNYHKSSGLWYSTVLRNVDLGENFGTDSGTRGEQNTDSFTLVINCYADRTIFCDDVLKKFVYPTEYQNTNNPESCFTFDLSQDFVVVGEVPLSRINENSETEGLYHRMNDSYDGVFAIKSYSFYALRPHFEVTGK